jgi:hypothetical protein
MFGVCGDHFMEVFARGYFIASFIGYLYMGYLLFDIFIMTYFIIYFN